MLRIAPRGKDFHSDIATFLPPPKNTGVAGEIRGSFSKASPQEKSPSWPCASQKFSAGIWISIPIPRPGDTFRRGRRKKETFNWRTCILRQNSRRGIRESWPRISRRSIPRSGGHRRVLHAGWQIHEEGFLHSPLKFAAPITSHFSNARFHPILKEYRPHLGIDYGAPSGTPVQTIGDGKVIFAGPKAGREI